MLSYDLVYSKDSSMQLIEIAFRQKIKNFHLRKIFYSNEIEHIDVKYLNEKGVALVKVGQYLALYSKHDLMACRKLDILVDHLTVATLVSALQSHLLKLKMQKSSFEFVRQGEAYRLCHGDHDGLAGITIDDYQQFYSVQSSSAASDLIMPMIIEALKALSPQKSILERSTGQVRQSVGLDVLVKWHHLPLEGLQRVMVAGKEMSFDPIKGQKTGLFLDQRINLQSIGQYIGQAERVLDICCYVGSWSTAVVSPIKMQHFTLIDQSGEALDLAKANIVNANASAEVETLHGDMFDHLKQLKNRQQSFDLIIADPPAFAKSKKHTKEALRAYERLFGLALSLLSPNGILVACSCSRHITDELFTETLVKLGEPLNLIYKGTSSPCHSHNLQVDVHDYLKCYFLKRI